MEFILYPWKNPVFKGGYKKTISWGDSLKRGAWTVWRFKGGIGKKEGDVVFKGGGGGGGETPMYTMVMMCSCFPFPCVRYHTRPHADASLYRLNSLSKLG